MSTTEVARFNIGGTKYEVSRSLLNTFPDTMLARSASDQWQADPEAEIFIERDGEIFRHVLSYLRDGKVILPHNVPKAAVLADLKYYGIENVSDDALDDSEKNYAQSAEVVKKFQEDVSKMVMKSNCALLAKKCLETYCSMKHDGNATLSFSITPDDKEPYQIAQDVYGYRTKGIDECNMHLGKVGLRMKYLNTYNQFTIQLQHANPVTSS